MLIEIRWPPEATQRKLRNRLRAHGLQLGDKLPKELESSLPTIEQIEAEFAPKKRGSHDRTDLSPPQHQPAATAREGGCSIGSRSRFFTCCATDDSGEEAEPQQAPWPPRQRT